MFGIFILILALILILNPPTPKGGGFPSRATYTPKEMQDLSLRQR